MNHTCFAASCGARPPGPAARALAMLAMAGLLGACASADAPRYEPASMQAPAASAPLPVTLYIPVPALAPPAGSVLTPLDYYEWAKAASREELRAERLRLSARRALEQQFPPEPGSAEPLIDAVHLAILLGESALASRESEREAMALLAGVAAANVGEAGRNYAIFADFLLSHLRQREELRTATSNVVASREELEMLERDRAQLQEKIDALTRIEEQLIEREQAQGD